VTAFSSAGRLLPAALRPVVLEDVPEGWERQAFDPSRDDDALTWLGFEPGDSHEPLLPWPRPANWPAGSRAGRHRAAARLRTA
jgi:hypothetical protein